MTLFCEKYLNLFVQPQHKVFANLQNYIKLQGFPRAVYTWGIWGGSAGGQSINGGTHQWDVDLMGGGHLTLIDYIIN